MTGENDVNSPAARLHHAEEARAEHARLTARLHAAEAHLQEREGEREQAERRSVAEQSDVARLEGISLGAMWASIKGTRAADMDRERAEADQARYVLARAETVADRARRERDDLAARLGALGDVDGEYERALEAVSSASSPELRGLATDARARLDRLRERRELDEATSAGTEALEALHQAQTALGKADDWSAWDTWGDGGMFSSAMKHQRLDEVGEHLATAAAALERFSHELADVDLPGVDAPLVDQFSRGLDIWFDNFFTDYAVRGRIKEAKAQLERSVTAVEDSLAVTRERRATLG